ncbi:HAD family hydrolase [Actinopolymorpha sp. B11F2]|uniref:HAD family hydrolase n=1 Tax=Actinopolymorpha sp. B11F2 TaxID=3160862 RepID=UPI0032E51524
MTTTIPSALVHVLAKTRCVLLDFDGPICAVFAHGRDAEVADELRAILRGHEIEPPDEVNNASNPLRILRYAYELGQADMMTEIEDFLREAELRAVADALPTPDAADTMLACHEAGRPLGIVSNNSAPAIEAFLDAHGLSHLVLAVVGRKPIRPDLMKPHPDPVSRVLAILDTPASDCVLVGDSLTDIEVAHATGVRSIGYIRSPSRRRALLAALPNAVTQSMATLAAAIRASQPAARTSS